MRERHGCEKKGTESRPLYRGGNPKKIYNRFQIGKKNWKIDWNSMWELNWSVLMGTGNKGRIGNLEFW